MILPNVSHCIAENDVHYNPKTKPQETRVVAKFNITDTSNPTQICGYTKGMSPLVPDKDYSSGFTSIEIDGVILPAVSYQYQFDTLGEHTVKYTLLDPTSIGQSAFLKCSGLTSIDIPDTVTSIGNGAFGECKSLTSIVIPDSVTSIGGGAFTFCTSLTSIVIPVGVTSIGDETFRFCHSLTSCTIGSGVTSIGHRAFNSCDELTNITVRATTAPTVTNTTFQSVKTDGILRVPTGSTGYDVWMQNANYYLGLYNWTKVEQ